MRQHDRAIRMTATRRFVRRTAWIGVLSASVLLHTSTDGAAQGTQDSQSFFHCPAQPQSSGKWYSKLMPWNKSASPPKFKTPPREIIKGEQRSEKVKAEGQLSFARLSERRGQPEQAKTIYLAFIEQHPNSPLPLHRLGVMAATEGDYKACDKYLSRAHQLDKRNPDLLADIGYSMYLRGRTEDAETFYRRALEVKRDHEAAANNLAMLLAETGRTTESLSLFKRVNDEAEAYANQGYILAQTGDLEQSQKYFNHALTLDATLTTAAQGLLQVAEFQQKRGSAPDFTRDSEPSQLAESTPPPSNRLTSERASTDRQHASKERPRNKTARSLAEVAIKDKPASVPRITADLKVHSAPKVAAKDINRPTATTKPRSTNDVPALAPVIPVSVPRTTVDLKVQNAPQVAVKDRVRPTATTKPPSTNDSPAPPPVIIANVEPELMPKRSQSKLVSLPTHESLNGGADAVSEIRDSPGGQATSKVNNRTAEIVRRTVPRSQKKAAATFNLLAHRRAEPVAQPAKSSFSTRFSDTPQQEQSPSLESVPEEAMPILPMRVEAKWGVTPVRPASIKSETRPPRELPVMDMTKRLERPDTSRGPREIRLRTEPQERPLWIRIDQDLKPVVVKESKE